MMTLMDELFEKYNVLEQLNAYMPQFDTINESEEKLPTKYPVKDAPKVKGWFGLISIKYMSKVRNIRKLCIQYINSYVESSLNIIKKLDKVKMIDGVTNLANELAMSYADKKNRERTVNTEAGLAFLGGDKALKDKLDAILAQIDTHAQKSDQLKEWADLMKLKSKEIACNIVFNETNAIIDKDASEKEKAKMEEARKKMEEAEKGVETQMNEISEKTMEVGKRIELYRKALTEYYKDKEGEDLPEYLANNGKFDQKKLESLSNYTLAKIIYKISDENERTELMKKFKITADMVKSDYEPDEDDKNDNKKKNEWRNYYGGYTRIDESSSRVLSFEEFEHRYLNESYIPIRGKVVTDRELRRAIAQAAKYDNGTQKVYAEDISAEPVILDSSVINGMKWAVLEIWLNGKQIEVQVMPYMDAKRDGHYVENDYDVLPLEAFTDESVNRLYDIIESYNDR